eukprot:scaffold641047_cov13-Prasinocladus_malaysianus.AAC.1
MHCFPAHDDDSTARHRKSELASAGKAVDLQEGAIMKECAKDWCSVGLSIEHIIACGAGAS